MTKDKSIFIKNVYYMLSYAFHILKQSNYEHCDSYGKECLTELTKALEDYRDDLVVIVAGYTEPMRPRRRLCP